jgi:protease-4
LSGEPDLFHGPSAEANQLIQTGVTSIYGKFLGLVAQSRRKSPADIDRIAQGRVWDGGTARQLGLVDGFGGMPEAIAKAAELAKLGDERGVTYLERPESLRDSILAMLAGEDEGSAPPDAFGALKAAPEMAILAAIGEVRAILAGPSIQVRCLECPPVARSRIVAADTGLFARLIGWLAS